MPIGLQLGTPTNTSAVVQVFINGYDFGHYLPHIGPQTRFPFPPGIINNQGESTPAMSLWALTEAGARLDQVELVAYGVLSDGIRLQPGLDIFAARMEGRPQSICVERQ